MGAPTIFISYSHKDEAWRKKLVEQLGGPALEKLVSVWDDQRIAAGDDWMPEIERAMGDAKVAILLVSASFLASKFIRNEEVRVLLERRSQGTVRVIPILIRGCVWDRTPWLSKMQMRPGGGRPLARRTKAQAEEALADIAREILDLLADVPPSTPCGSPKWLPPEDVSLTHLPITEKLLLGRDAELARLDAAWEGRKTRVLSIVAMGGTGKSALVNTWLRRMGDDHYRGAHRVFGWSFYSQGTSDGAASSDPFIDAALRWFGDPDPAQGSSPEKTERLARLVRRERTLLILDGLEPLQHPPGVNEGWLKDRSVSALLRDLAATGQALCVVTTRLPVEDLADHEDHGAERIDLDKLSKEAGAALLEELGARGTLEEREKATEDFQGHALALTLLARYLVDACGGDIRKRGEIGPLEEEERRGGHAKRVMVSYEKWLGEGPALSVLRLLGLFDRPANGGAIAALRASPLIKDLTEAIQGLSERDWNLALQKLRRARLLAEASKEEPSALDAHPLVREHFGAELRKAYPEAWREGHSRLFEHLQKVGEEFPKTVDAMAPLYAAVRHGCLAERRQEALEEVFLRRVHRGQEFFNLYKLGAFGSELVMLSGFFDPPWKRLAPGLTEPDQGFVLNEAGIALRAMGRLAEAAEPMRLSLEIDIARDEWKGAAISASNLSELHLAAGDIEQAVAVAQQSVELADRSEDWQTRIVGRTTLADAQHQAGRTREARAVFEEAEGIQKEDQPEYPRLYSLRGYRYCDLLLDQGSIDDVLERAEQTLGWAERGGLSILTIALDHLSLGRAHLLTAEGEGSGDLAQAKDHLDQAVEGLLRAGDQEFVARGLLARADLRRVTQDFPGAEGDLTEALSIATRGGMRLLETDAHLGWARLHLARGDHTTQANESLAKARRLIDTTGYHRRDKALAELSSRLAAPEASAATTP